MSLTTQLKEKLEANLKAIPADITEIMNNATEALKAESLAKKAFKEGDSILNAKLLNAQNKEIEIASLNSNGPLIISFYRGGWCPYCNLELKALQNALPKFKALGAQLIAITPETPDNSLSTAEKNELSFEVLSDLGNVYAKKLGLVFEMPEDLRAIYHQFGLDVPKHNGDNSYELPMPATFVIDPDGKIILSFVAEDYTKRLDPEVIISALEKL